MIYITNITVQAPIRLCRPGARSRHYVSISTGNRRSLPSLPWARVGAGLIRKMAEGGTPRARGPPPPAPAYRRAGRQRAPTGTGAGRRTLAARRCWLAFWAGLNRRSINQRRRRRRVIKTAGRDRTPATHAIGAEGPAGGRPELSRRRAGRSRGLHNAQCGVLVSGAGHELWTSPCKEPRGRSHWTGLQNSVNGRRRWRPTGGLRARSGRRWRRRAGSGGGGGGGRRRRLQQLSRARVAAAGGRCHVPLPVHVV